MTTYATALREAIVARAGGLGNWGSIRRTPVPQLQPDKLPALNVFIAAETMTPDGDANAGEPSFESVVTIAISVVRGFKDPAVLDGEIDAEVDIIEQALLCDATLQTSPEGEALYEAVTGIRRRRLFPQEGETYFAELRLEIDFMLRVDFPPAVLDDFLGANVSARPFGSTASTPLAGMTINPPTD